MTPIQNYNAFLDRWAEQIETTVLNPPAFATQKNMVYLLNEFANSAREVLSTRFIRQTVHSDDDEREWVRVTDNFLCMACDCDNDYEAMKWEDQQRKVRIV